MSTRATYRFLTTGRRNDYSGALTFYIHHDGYELGAAEYFARMVAKQAETRGGLVEAFVRANEGAELTGGHEAHGDTEYRYTVGIEDGGVSLFVHHRPIGGAWRPVFGGSLVEFLNAQYKQQQAEAKGWPEVLQASGGFVMLDGGAIVSVAWLTARARGEMAQALSSLEKGWTGNASAQAGAAAKFVGLGAAVAWAEVVAVLTQACASCPHMVAYYLTEAGLPVALTAEIAG